MEPTKTPIKWTKFYDTETKTAVTYYNESKTLADIAVPFEFETPEETQSKSTVEDFIFWNNEPVGAGLVSA